MYEYRPMGDMSVFLHISLIAQLLIYVFYILDLISYHNKCNTQDKKHA